MMHTQKTYHQIIVLGNGFDLACELPSTYQDFFIWRIKQLQFPLITPQDISKQDPLFPLTASLRLSSISDGKMEAEEKLDSLWKFFAKKRQTSLADFFPYDTNSKWIQSFNFWDLVFLLYDNDKDKNWFDVENIMDSFLEEIFVKKEFMDSSQSAINNYKKLCILLAITMSDNQKQTFLKNQLIIFERNFASYIATITENNKKFKNNAKEKFSEILYAHKPKYEKSKATILSFNYSLCDQDNVKDSNYIYRWFNIHGYANYTINNNSEYLPIFGIDSTSLKNESDFRNIFTKSYQVALNNIDRYKLEFPSEAYCISFYGHSLAHADYSYFESLFDMYNLYSSKIYLCFYCGVYDPNDQQTLNKKKEELTRAEPTHSVTDKEIKNSIEADNNKIKQELMTNIYKLIYHYGVSLSNNHGDNLFHRLLLEGRLRVDLDYGAREY